MCDTCIKGFLKSYKLMRHLHIHTTFFCSMLLKYYQKEDLNVDLRTHSEEKVCIS